MKPVVLCFLAPVLLSSATPGAAWAEPRASVEDVFRAWSQRQERVRTLQIDWIETFTDPKGMLPGGKYPLQDTTYDLKRRFMIDGEKMCLTSDGLFWSPIPQEFGQMHYVSTYDGKESKSFYSGSSARDYPWGFVWNLDKNSEVDAATILPILFFYRPTSGQLTRTRFNKATCTIGQAVGVAQDRPCLIIQEPQPPAGPDFKQSAWVDENMDFAILRYLIDFHGKTVFRADISYKTDPATGIFPCAWNCVVMNPHTSMLRQSWSAKVTACSVNLPIEPKDFSPEFPPGTMVEDHKGGTRFIAMQGGRRRFVTPEENQRGATYAELLAASTQSRVSMWKRVTQWSVPLILVLFVVTGLTWWRLRQARRAL
jgi:hypothetical protein